MNKCKDRMNVTLRNYQEEAIEFLNGNDGKLVLAMCPSSGKTETIIYYLNQQYNINPNLKVLILPHSTNVLLDNFYERLETRNIDFTYSAEITDDVNVHVILPQNHNRIVGKYDLIIIDEAHENYLAKTIQGIIKKTQADKEILLTGTPSKFIGNNDFKLHFVALSDLCELYTPKLRIDILESDYDWNGNYNNHTKELKNSYKFTKESTEISLKKTFDFLLKRNNSDSVEKTLIVCRNIAQSNYVRNYLTSIGFSSEISNSDNDKDSENVSKFKNNLIDILIVVNRARLGYDDADLINLIDMSGTLNPNIIYQMFARLLRGTQDMKKYYIRLASKNDDVYSSEIATSVALMLTHTNYIKVFNGKNFNTQEIIVNKDFFIKSKKSLEESSGKSKNLSKRKLFIDFQDDDNFNAISLFKKVIEEKEKNVGLYKFCKVQDVLNEMRFKYITRTKEECIEDAKKYNTITDWIKNSNTIQSYSSTKEWYSECTAHMTKLMNPKTKEECIADAKKYTTIKDWKINSSTIYGYSVYKKWLDECTAHMTNLSGISRTLEECIEDAKKYNTIKDWLKNSPKIYFYVRHRKWLKECTAHMDNLVGISRTKEECLADAKKYKTIKEWVKNSLKIYNYARSYKWLDECTAHMTKLNGVSRTKEECIADARKYKTVKEWTKNSSLFHYSYQKGWNKECTAHMTKLNGVSRTKEECIADARKYKTVKEWVTNNKLFYNYSTRKKWLDECTAHMINLSGNSKTKEECIEDAKKYKTIKDWNENSSNFYQYARKKGWIEECSAHMTKLNGKSRTKEECIADAKKYNSKAEWVKNSPTIYGYSQSKEWYDECTAHMVKLINSRTKEECIEDAKKYNTITDWIKNSNTIYGYARSKEWYYECTAHMVKLNGVSRTKQECIADAKKYTTIKEWAKNSPTIYPYAKSKEWHNECSAHMTKLNGKSRTKEECIKDAKKYKTKKDWRINSSTIYGYVISKKWLKECSEHFEK